MGTARSEEQGRFEGQRRFGWDASLVPGSGDLIPGKDAFYIYVERGLAGCTVGSRYHHAHQAGSELCSNMTGASKGTVEGPEAVPCTQASACEDDE